MEHCGDYMLSGAFMQDALARPQGIMPNPYHTPYPSFTNEGTIQPQADARADYDHPDGKHHLIFAGGYGATGGVIHTHIGPFRVDQGYRKSFGKVDYVRGMLRISGYVNLFGGSATSLLVAGPDGQPIRLDDRTESYDIEFGDMRPIRSRHLISYGGNFRHNGFNVSIAPEGKNRNQGGAYAQDEIRLSERFRWILGARIDKFDFMKGAVFSPRTTFLFKPAPGQTFRVSYNRAYMAPTLLANHERLVIMGQLDLGLIQPQLAGNYFDFPVRIVGNLDLKEQSLHAYELG